MKIDRFSTNRKNNLDNVRITDIMSTAARTIAEVKSQKEHFWIRNFLIKSLQ